MVSGVLPGTGTLSGRGLIAPTSAPGAAGGVGPPASDGARQIYLTCAMHGASYLVPMAAIREVEEVGGLTPVPNTPPWLRGVMNLRGTIVPVVDVARFLGFTEELSRGAEALICGDDDAPLALLVDAVGTIRPATGAEIAPVPEHVEGMLARYLTGLYRAPDGLLGVLDFRQLLRALELGRATSDE